MPRWLLHCFLSPFLCMRMITLQLTNLAVPFQNSLPPDTKESAKELYSKSVEHFSLDFIAAYSVLTARKTSAAGMVFSSPNIPRVCSVVQ